MKATGIIFIVLAVVLFAGTAMAITPDEAPIPTPEPATIVLLSAGMIGLGIFGKKIKNRKHDDNDVRDLILNKTKGGFTMTRKNFLGKSVCCIYLSICLSVIGIGGWLNVAHAENPPSFVMKWGSFGTADNQLWYPVGIVVDSMGNLYVMDGQNHRILKFNANGVLLKKWGKIGSGDGEFSQPNHIALDNLGNVYVADGWNCRIQKFDSNGNFLLKWGTEGSGDGQLYRPFGIAIDSSNNVYVTDTLSNTRIQKFTSSGIFITKWGTNGSGDGQFKQGLSAIAVDSSDNIYVADGGNNRIQKFSSNGTFLMKWGGFGSTDGLFNGPYGITVDKCGNVYVMDACNYRVQKFSNTGTFLSKWGSSGTGDGQFDQPVGIAIDKCNTVYVADTYNSRIQKFAYPADGCNAVTEIPVSECQSLLDLYNSTDGVNWTNKTGWNVTNTPCSWFGVSCSGGHVDKLDLSHSANDNFWTGNNLKGSIPNLNLPNLTSLNLSFNQLNGTIPNFNLPSLTELKLFVTKLSGVIPNFNTPNLTHIELNSNQLTGTIPNFNLPKLTFLNLYNNQLSGTIPNFNMPNLSYLDLSSNQLSGTIPNFNMPNLFALRLFSNQLSGTIPNLNMPGLTDLSLHYNKLSGTIPNFNLPSLTIFRIEFNQLTGTIPNLNFSAITYSTVNNNCGLVAFDAAQETVWNQKDPIWKQINPACPVMIPTISAVTPNTGTSAGETPITITGTNFVAGSTSVTFGGVPATNVNVTSATSLTCKTPAHAAGIVDVVVTVAGLSATKVGGFTYIQQYTVTFQAGTGGTVNGTITQTVNQGGNCTAVTAVSNTGYQFVNWTGTGGFVSTTANPLTVSNVTANMTITANFQPIPNTAPIAFNGSLSATSGVSANGTLTATDANGDVLTYSIISQPAKGTVAANPTYPSFKYTPNAGVMGTDTFTFKANDGKADSNIATVTITINPIPIGTFIRTLPSCYIAGKTLDVTVSATPSSATNSYAVEDTPPSGWTVSNISNGGVFDSGVNKVKFGPFFDSVKRDLTYDLTPPASESGDKSINGKASSNGVSSDITGQTVISACQLYHPADMNQDFRIVMDELTAYGSAWKSGAAWSVPPNPIPIDYVIRAATIWKSGESYKYDSSVGTYPLCWISTSTQSAKAFRSKTVRSESSAVRQMPAIYQAGQTITVSVAVTAASSVIAYGVEDQIPAGWTVSEIDNGGEFDNVNGKVKFGPFIDNQSRTLTYQVTPPADAKGIYKFSGTASFDGNKSEISGNNSVTDDSEPGNIDGNQTVDLGDAIKTLQVLAGLNPSNVFASADVNGDSRIGLEEVVYILQKVAGLR